METDTSAKTDEKNRDNNQENKHRVDYDYEVGDDIMVTNHTAYKYGTQFEGLFLISQCFTNATVNPQRDLKRIGYNIRHIKPYKLDTKVEDYNSINISDYVST